MALAVIQKVEIGYNKYKYKCLASTKDRVWVSKLFDKEEEAIEAAREYESKASRTDQFKV
jgi:hypothetical protein